MDRSNQSISVLLFGASQERSCNKLWDVKMEVISTTVSDGSLRFLLAGFCFRCWCCNCCELSE
jgi:hypothetical protein